MSKASFIINFGFHYLELAIMAYPIFSLSLDKCRLALFAFKLILKKEIKKIYSNNI